MLQTLLGTQAADEQELYADILCRSGLPAMTAAFDVAFEAPVAPNQEIRLHQPKSIWQACYIVHTQYEFRLLLDGRKTLARISDCYPPHVLTAKIVSVEGFSPGRARRSVLSA